MDLNQTSSAHSFETLGKEENNAVELADMMEARTGEMAEPGATSAAVLEEASLDPSAKGFPQQRENSSASLKVKLMQVLSVPDNKDIDIDMEHSERKGDEEEDDEMTEVEEGDEDEGIETEENEEEDGDDDEEENEEEDEDGDEDEDEEDGEDEDGGEDEGDDEGDDAGEDEQNENHDDSDKEKVFDEDWNKWKQEVEMMGEQEIIQHARAAAECAAAVTRSEGIIAFMSQNLQSPTDSIRYASNGNRSPNVLPSAPHTFPQLLVQGANPTSVHSTSTGFFPVVNGFSCAPEEIGNRRFLNRAEYLTTMLQSWPSDFSLNEGGLLANAYRHQMYEALLTYVTALDNAGKISRPQEIVILAAAHCFRPTGMECEVNQRFGMAAYILQGCHDFARAELLRFIKAMLDRAPGDFLPRGQDLVPILNGLGLILDSYYQLILSQVLGGIGKNEEDEAMQERLRIAQENAWLAIQILECFARDATHWVSLNSSRAIRVALCCLLFATDVVPCIHKKIMDYMALNVEFLPSMDVNLPDNIILDAVISSYEFASGMAITALNYPNFMTGNVNVNDASAAIIAHTTLSILYNYSERIPKENVALPRLVDVLSELLISGGTNMGNHRRMLCATTKRLFERFPEEFEVTHNFYGALVGLIQFPDVREYAYAMLQIIQIHSATNEHLIDAAEES